MTRVQWRRIPLLLALLSGSRAVAATALETVRLSPDISLQIGAVVTDDEGAIADDLAGTPTPIDVGPVPGQADVDGLAVDSNGDVLLSFDTTIVLPGAGTVRPGDVVRYDGSGYSIVFDASANGVPAAADVDAVAVAGSALYLSFDVTIDFGGLIVHDEDLLAFDEVSGVGIFFDGSTAGIDPSLDLDAAHYIECNDHLILSFDGGGSVAGVSFDDDDLLEHDRGAAWELAYDGVAQAAAWLSADVDATDVTVDPGSGPPAVFGQTIRAQGDKTTYAWTSPVDYQGVRGSFTTPTQIGSYAHDLHWFDSGSSFSDLTVPAAGSGLWYLVKPGGCLASSWQSTAGAEPGRDLGLP
jgi:hypothetical protein